MQPRPAVCPTWSQLAARSQVRPATDLSGGVRAARLTGKCRRFCIRWRSLPSCQYLIAYIMYRQRRFIRV